MTPGQASQGSAGTDLQQRPFRLPAELLDRMARHEPPDGEKWLDRDRT